MRREIAVGIAATIVFYLSAMFIPLAGFVAGMFTSLPTLLAFYRWGSPAGYWIPGGVAVLGTAILTHLSMVHSVPYLLEMLFLGVFLGVGMRMRWSPERTIGLAALLVCSTSVLTLWLFMPDFRDGLFDALEKELREAVIGAVAQYAGHIQDKQAFEQALLESVPALVRLFPGMALASVLVVAWLNVIVTTRFCRLHGILLPPWPEWPLWKSPESLVWGLIGSGFIVLFTTGQPRLIASNLLVVLGLIYFLHGLAVVGFYLGKWGLPRIARAFIYAVLFLQQFATLGVVLVGLFDMWVDFRRLTRKPDEEDELG